MSCATAPAQHKRKKKRKKKGAEIRCETPKNHTKEAGNGADVTRRGGSKRRAGSRRESRQRSRELAELLRQNSHGGGGESAGNFLNRVREHGRAIDPAGILMRRTCGGGRHEEKQQLNYLRGTRPNYPSENETRSHTQHAVSERVCISGGGTTRISEAVVNARVDLTARDNKKLL